METTKTSPGGFTGAAAAVCGVVIVALWITGIMQILAGVLAGTLIVLALMMTIERIPGFWAFATTGIGTIVVLFGTAWATHAVLGADTIIGMIALCWSLVLKVLILDERKKARRLEGATIGTVIDVELEKD